MSLTLPDGRVEEFDLVVSPDVSPIVPFPPFSQSVSFRPRPGTLGQLESLDDNNVSILDAQPGPVDLRLDSGGDIYDPQRFRYTAADGTQIDIHKTDGVERIIDPNGNTLTFGPDGITHSAGKSVALRTRCPGAHHRDHRPGGQQPDLQLRRQRRPARAHRPEDYTTRFDYNRNHGLIKITDPLDRPLARNEYDDDGRLIATTDAAGNGVDLRARPRHPDRAVTDRSGNLSSSPTTTRAMSCLAPVLSGMSRPIRTTTAGTSCPPPTRWAGPPVLCTTRPTSSSR